MGRKLVKRAPWALGLTLLACASQNYVAKKGHNHFRNSEYEAAAIEFEKELPQAKANVVLYRLDAGMSRFRLGQYREAIQHFLAAEKQTEIKDYTSVSEEVGTLLASDNVRGYKGEDYEKLMINVYLALSYAALGEFDEARVEARKINHAIGRLVHDGKRNYSEWPLARYLSGMLWEYDRGFDNAYIEYKKVYELDPTFPGIGGDLVSMARKNGAQEDLQKWSKIFPDARTRALKKGSREWVVFYESGQIARKVPRGEDPSLPTIPYSTSDERGFRIKSGSQTYECGAKAMDLARTARNYLEDRIVRMKLAKIAGMAAKYAAAQAVSHASDSEGLGLITYFALMAMDQADLRSWMSLPHDLYMCRFADVPADGVLEVEILGPQNTVLRSFSKEWKRRASPRQPVEFWVFSQ